MKYTFLLLLLLSNFAFISDSESKCDDNIISHCSKCNTGEDSDTCATCDDKYFPFLSDLICLPCNDSLYGQIGCAGKCDGSDFMNDHFVSCEKGTCKKRIQNYPHLFTCNINSFDAWFVCISGKTIYGFNKRNPRSGNKTGKTYRR